MNLQEIVGSLTFLNFSTIQGQPWCIKCFTKELIADLRGKHGLSQAAEYPRVEQQCQRKFLPNAGG